MLQKSFCGDHQNFSGSLMPFARGMARRAPSTDERFQSADAEIKVEHGVRRRIVLKQLARLAKALRWCRTRRVIEQTRSNTTKYGGRHRSTYFAARHCEARVAYGLDKEPRQGISPEISASEV
jgi:hypothetical protein